MAIRRCPYCKAIIDEEDKYCNNCGTQLLFPEDESVEEEIPGDKIIEEEEGEEQEEEEGVKEEEAEEETDVGEEEFKEEGEEEETTEEFETAEEEKEAEEAAGGEEIEKPEERPREDFLKAEEGEGPEKKYKISLEDDELVIKTKELEKLTQTVEEGKKHVEELMASYKEKAAKKEGTPSLFREEEQEDAIEEEAEGKVAKEKPSDTKEGLPPWVSGIKEVPPTSEMADQEEDIKEKQRPGRREWTADSGIGLPPEKLTQTALPFADTATLEEAEKIETKAEEKAEAEEKEEAEVFAAPSRRPFRLKAKLVDLVFITAFWLVSLWFTAQVIGVSFFRLMAKSPLPVLGFYLILALLYFFLFLYFIGETLGDHYFSEEE